MLSVLALKTLATLVEGFGLAMLVPVFEMADNAGVANEERSSVWQAVAGLFEYLGLPMIVEALLITTVIMVILRQILVYAHRVYLVSAQQQMIAILRHEGVAASLATRLDYHDRHTTGAIVNDLAQEIRRAVAVAFAAISAAGNLIMTATYMIGMAVAAGWIVFFVLAGAIGLAPAMRGLLNRTRFESEALATANRGFSTLVLERLRAVRLLKLSLSEKQAGDEVGATVEQVRHSTVSLAKMQALIPLVIEPAGALLLAGLFYSGVRLLALPLELVMVVILVIVRLIPVIQEIAKAVQTLLANIGSMRFVVERFNTAREAAEERTGSATMPKPLSLGLAFQDITYRYSESGGRKAALSGLNAFFPARKFNAIVGPSGAGKSTLIDLIPRLRTPESGVITIDGRNILEIDTATLRMSIAFVPQSPDLLAGTIAEHIRMGNDALTAAQVEEAARLAGLRDFIEGTPLKYDTPLGEGGIGLSGGQTQRLDLARAIARGAPILILDEPASNLDPESEEVFLRVLRRIRMETETTVILIAHRFASIMAADRITVIQDGRAVAAGTHDELMAESDWYKVAFDASGLSATPKPIQSPR